MSAMILSGSKISQQVRQEVQDEVCHFTIETGIVPSLAVILASDDSASRRYVTKKTEACTRVGIEGSVFDYHQTDKILTPSHFVLYHLERLTRFHGTLLQLPVEATSRAETKLLFDAINPLKDVDVFHPENVGLLLQDRPRFKTCTPAGIIELISRSGLPIEGKTFCIINHSDLVGKPLAALLLHLGATVTVCHKHTPEDYLVDSCKSSDYIVVAVGIPGFLTPKMVTPQSVVIDVGINHRDDGKLVGDVDPSVYPIIRAYSPVPGGVGAMTVAMLLKNTLMAAKIQVCGENPRSFA